MRQLRVDVTLELIYGQAPNKKKGVCSFHALIKFAIFHKMIIFYRFLGSTLEACYFL